MVNHPPKLIVIFAIYGAKDYRRHLSAIDDALVVHRSVDGRFRLELRPMVRLTARGTCGYGTILQRLATELEAGYRMVIVDRDTFLADLESLAREHATESDRDAIERAAQVVAERTAFQIFDHLFDAPVEYRMGRMILAGRERRTKAERNEQDSLNCQFGIPTPRSEQLWHSLRHQWCTPRDEGAGKKAWQDWCRANRPDMPKIDAA
ncbi:hypothetical protein [Sphingomonas sp. ABOLG]|uniref:hypothetical protein n=2 Tax=Sphingomonas TaxID=13687 RepID=UPI000F7DE87C|nr:hypothetical protein [Sphingomonas sp. ABOLG]RSV19248.1 hypothetical protein CA236_04170 [Sphingomonas sp. ABOLG]